MARGTGLPFQDDNATVQPPQGINAEAMSDAQSWQNIAQTGHRLQDASIDYARREMHQKRVGYLAGADVEIDRQGILLHDRHARDPEAFDQAWTAYSQGRVQAAEPWAAQHIQQRLGVVGNRHFSSILGERRADDTRLDRDRITTLLGQASDEVLSAAQAGELGGERGGAAMLRLGAIYNAAVSAGLMTQEAADSRRNDVFSRATGETIVRGAVDSYRSHLAAGVPDAVEASRREVERLLTEDNPQLSGLSPDERRQYVARAMSRIQALDTVRQMDLGRARQEAATMRTGITAGVPPDPDRADALIDRLEAAGGHQEAMQLRAVIVRQPRLESMGRQPLGQQIETFRNLATDAGVGFSPEVNTALSTVAQETGRDVSLYRRMARIESGGNPNAVNQYGYRGLFQFSPAEWQRYGQGGDINNPLDNARAFGRRLDVETREFRTREGREPSAFDLYMVHQQGAGGYHEHLANPTRPAWQNMLGTGEGRNRPAIDSRGRTPEQWAQDAIWQNMSEADRRRFPNGVESVTSEDFIRLWRRRVEGSEQPGPDMATIVGGREIIRNTARQAWEHLDAEMTAGRAPTPDQLREVARAAQTLGDDQLLDTMGERLGRFYAANAIGQQPTAAVRNIQTELSTAQTLSPGQTALLGDVGRIITENAHGLTADPIALGARRFPELIQLPPPLNLDDREAALAGLQERARISRFVGERIGGGRTGITVLGEADRAAIVGAISSGDPRRMGTAYEVLASVPDEALHATLHNPQLLEAIRGASRSNAVATFTATMQALDRLWARAPQEFNSTFGEDMVRTLQDWQGLLRYHTPQELAEVLRRRSHEDPQAREHRQHQEAEGRRLASAMTIENLTSALGPGFFRGGISVPLDADTRHAVLGDYTRLFAERFAATGDRATAQQQTYERMRLYWGRSDVNGGRLTLYPPESTYAAVDGSHAWMQRDIERDLIARGINPTTGRLTPLDPEIGTAALEFPRGYRQVVTPRMAGAPQVTVEPPPLPTYSLHADHQTEEEVSRGRPASYRVFFRRPDNTMDAVRDETGQPLRYFWDRERVAAESREEFRRQRERILGRTDEMVSPLLQRAPFGGITP